MNILLINPELPKDAPLVKIPTPPMGLMCIAAVLENEGFEVVILDNNLLELPQIQLSAEIKNVYPDIVGITSDSATFYQSLRIANSVKSIFRNHVPVVIGGPQVNVRCEKVLRYPEVDFVVYGEGEYTMLELCEAIAKNKTKSSIRGLGFKEKGQTKINPPRPFIDNLDDLPFPARHLVPMANYPRRGDWMKIAPVDQVSTSRGCPFDCAFCSNNYVWGRKYRYRSARNVLKEIAMLIRNFGTKGIYFREDVLTINRQRVVEICEGINRQGLHIKWECESRVDTVDRELLEKMRGSGCENIWFGVETGNQKTLDMLKKGITTEQTKNAFKWCNELGIKTGASIILGIPYETIEDMKKTIQFTTEINAYWVMLNIFTGIPTSKMYDEVVKNDWIDSNYGDILFVKTDSFNRKEMERFRRSMEKQLYLNPRWILRMPPRWAAKDIPSLIKRGISLFLQK